MKKALALFFIVTALAVTSFTQTADQALLITRGKLDSANKLANSGASANQVQALKNEALAEASSLYGRAITEAEVMSVTDRMTGKAVSTFSIGQYVTEAWDAAQLIILSKGLIMFGALLATIALITILWKQIARIAKWIKDHFAEIWPCIKNAVMDILRVGRHIIGPALLVAKPFYPEWVYYPGRHAIAFSAYVFISYSLWELMDRLDGKNKRTEKFLERTYLTFLTIIGAGITFLFASHWIGILTVIAFLLLIAIFVDKWQGLRNIGLQEDSPDVGIFVCLIASGIYCFTHGAGVPVDLFNWGLALAYALTPVGFLIGVFEDDKHAEFSKDRKRYHLWLIATIVVSIVDSYAWSKPWIFFGAAGITGVYLVWWSYKVIDILEIRWYYAMLAYGTLFITAGSLLYKYIGVVQAVLPGR